MVIAETASRNVVYKATELGESIFERQSEMLIPEEDLAVRSSVTNEEDLKDLGYNADLYVFNDQTVEGYRNTNIDINSRENADLLLLREMHMRDSSLALHGSGSILLSGA